MIFQGHVFGFQIVRGLKTLMTLVEYGRSKGSMMTGKTPSISVPKSAMRQILDAIDLFKKLKFESARWWWDAINSARRRNLDLTVIFSA